MSETTDLFGNQSGKPKRLPRWCKVRRDQYPEICRRYEAGESAAAMAAECCVTRKVIYDILRRCGAKPPPLATMCEQCKIRPRYKKSSLCLECLRPITAARMAARRERHIAQGGVCRECGELLDTIYQYCSRCLKRKQEATKRWKLRNKIACFEAYGGCYCACCGMTGDLSFLSIDHKNSDGAEHRRAIGMAGQGGHRFYSWLKKNGYPPGYQVLCHACQWGRQLNGGVCPHQQKQKEPFTFIA